MSDRRENDASRSQEVARLYEAFLAAILAGDEVAAEVTIREAMDTGLATGRIDDAIIAPALWVVGELWEQGEITVAEEHLATEICARVLALQRETMRVVRSRAGHRVMLATPSGELHVIALRMVANLLREAGYVVVMLGADVPADALAHAAARHKADVVCMSSTMPGGGDRLLLAMREVQQTRPQATFVVGGRGLTSRVRGWPGIEICERVP